ncbi:hypothetical protein MS3_00002193 [Schistosoma haematobium]|uniref:Uncharacterized protein n=1 Tax=Schistosoma haematobium TaxID=6185 RepID=A0A095AW78_SCHHA|nr:hypothetical protein MS3_00002193 [Schistosoma haematobium]KAH9593869.1 hypothetical protein MS3_00002193 [Schistosoma haematobium]CAH8433837.1 unnamed protein product [Schistosoma haematobium]
MDNHLGPPTYNYFTKEKPQTTNQQYGFFYREEQVGDVDTLQNKAACNEMVTSSHLLKHHTKFRSSKLRPPLPRKITYHTASPLAKHKKECEVGGGRKYPDTRLTRVKGIQLWHAHTGSLVHVEP